MLGIATLNGTGQATLTTAALALGTDALTAVYSSDAIYGASTSNAVDVTVTTAPALTLSATSIAFGNEKVGSTSAVKTIHVTHGGSVSVSFKSIGLTGGSADDFALTTTCGATLAVKATCTLSVKFKPVASGSKSASVQLTDDAAKSPQSITVTGTGD